MTLDRYGIHFGVFTLHFYGLLIMFGVLVAAWLANRRCRDYDQDPEQVWDMVTWVLIGGVIGARLWHIFTPPPSMVEQGVTAMYYLTHPLDAIAIWRGGLGIPGAVMGGALALYMFTRSKRLSYAAWLDILAPGLILAQAIGRWGNFVNQELYGAPTNLPWAIFIDAFHRLPEYADVAYYHPLFLYESIWNLTGAALLLWLSRYMTSWLKRGDLFLVYLIFYPVGRFLLDFLRLDASQVGGLNVNQTLMGVVALAAAAALFWRHRKPEPLQDEDSDEDSEAGEDDAAPEPSVKVVEEA